MSELNGILMLAGVVALLAGLHWLKGRVRW